METSSQFSPALHQFLAERFRSEEDLLKSPEVELELRRRCADLEAALADLGRRLSSSIVSYASRSDEAGGMFRGIKEGLINLQSSISDSNHGEKDNEDLEKTEEVLAEDLPALAKEVARVETIRIYAETALKLDGLIGDVEDSVSSSVTGKLKSPHSINSAENWRKAISLLKQTETILSTIAKTRPQWARLTSAVDHRVDRALAVLRPQAISDHRSLLSSLRWPPPVTGSNLTPNNPTNSNSTQFSNPLFSLKGDLKSKYSESFLSLCNLQELQRERKSRQLEGQSRNFETLIRQPLWAIEELVNPLSVSAQRFFSKWIEKPEFIFALVFKIIRDFVGSMDDILQPLVDKANLLGYSCREEWISGLVTSLNTYLSKEIFPNYIDSLQEENDSSNEARVSWLNLVDLMISFDKRTQTLISDTGLLMSLKEDENLQRVSSLSVFCDRPDWLEIWAEIEKNEMINKLKPALQNEGNWSRIGSDETKSPVASCVAIQYISSLVDRVRPLPSVELRARFITLTCGPVLSEFIDFLLQRCQEAEGLTALTDDSAVLKVVQSINSARFFESSLNEWCEDLFFLELEIDGECIFKEEINRIKEFRVEWVEKIIRVILRGFDARTRDYVKNKRQWQERMEGLGVSRSFIDSLDFVQGKISRLEKEFNSVDFVIMWRGVANGIDQLIFNGVLIGGVKFNNFGVERLDFDLGVLFGVLRAWCLRPEGFFSKLGEGIRVLKMDELEIRNGFLKEREKWMKERGLRFLNLVEVDKLVKSRSFEG
ncbi:hypothetical protein LUZ60_000988 [Juncus effusus]|nr:hypothetical protein LUZ60_000988 [Juncus effusus]